MRKLLFLGACMASLALAACGGEGEISSEEEETAGLGVFSEGHRVGQLTKFSVKGIKKTGEGQMLMGRESTPYVIDDGDGGKKTINPWYFSSDKSMASKIENYAGQYVVMRYTQAQIQNPFYGTDYTVQEVTSVTRDDWIPKSTNCSIDKPDGSKSDGFRVGRIVKASRKGSLAKTWEVMIQVGNSGNQFKNMSIVNERIYKCAVNSLKRAQKVTVRYKESFFGNPISGRDTNYQIWSIDVGPDI